MQPKSFMPLAGWLICGSRHRVWVGIYALQHPATSVAGLSSLQQPTCRIRCRLPEEAIRPLALLHHKLLPANMTSCGRPERGMKSNPRKVCPQPQATPEAGASNHSNSNGQTAVFSGRGPADYGRLPINCREALAPGRFPGDAYEQSLHLWSTNTQIPTG